MSKQLLKLFLFLWVFLLGTANAWADDNIIRYMTLTSSVTAGQAVDVPTGCDSKNLLWTASPDGSLGARFYFGDEWNTAKSSFSDQSTIPYFKIPSGDYSCFSNVNENTGFTIALEACIKSTGTDLWGRLIDASIYEGSENKRNHFFAWLAGSGNQLSSEFQRYAFGKNVDQSNNQNSNFTGGWFNQTNATHRVGASTNTSVTTITKQTTPGNYLDEIWHSYMLRIDASGNVECYVDGTKIYHYRVTAEYQEITENDHEGNVLVATLKKIKDYAVAVGTNPSKGEGINGWIRNVMIVPDTETKQLKAAANYTNATDHGELYYGLDANTPIKLSTGGVMLPKNSTVYVLPQPITGYYIDWTNTKAKDNNNADVALDATTHSFSMTSASDPVTISASFPELDRTIQYETNGESITGMPANQNFKYFTGNLTISGTTPVHPNGYGFLGWTTDKNALSVEYTKGQVIAADNTSTPTSARGQFSNLADANGVIKLYPVWQKPLYELTADMDLVDTWTIPTVTAITIDLKGHIIRQTIEGKRVIEVPAGATLTIIDTSEGGNGSITGGSPATENGGGIYVASNATLNLNGGHITGNKATLGGGVYSDGTLNIAGKVKVTGNTLTDGTTASNLYLPTNKKANITAALSEGTSIGVTMQTNGTFTDGIADNATAITYLGYFTSDDATKAVQLDNAGNLKIDVPPVAYLYSDAACTTLKGQYTTLQAAINAAVTGEGVKLVSNVTESVTFSTEGKSMTLDMDGKTLTAAASNRAIDMSAGTLTITGGTITGGNVTGNGGGINVTGGSLTLDGVNVTGNQASGNGGGVYFNGTALYLKGATKITGNTGGNLYLASGKKVDISNGLASDASIGVTLASTTGTFTTGNESTTFDPTTYFSSDNASYAVLHELDDSNQAQIYSYSGTDGNIDWVYDRATTTLTLSKRGDASSGGMNSYRYDNTVSSRPLAPWNPFHKVMTTLIVESGVTTIGDACCQGFTSLNSVTLPEGITSIGICAFNGCSALTAINLPYSLTTIYNVAFAHTGLTSIVIPEKVTKIFQLSFDNIPSLNTFVMLRTTTPLTTISSRKLIFNGTNNVTIYVPNSKVNSYQGAQYWSSYKTRIKGWTYRLSGGESGNATLTLSSTSEMYTGSAIEPTALSLKIKADAAVPLYNTEATPAQIESITYKFSETADTEVVSTNYTLTYTDDHTNVGTKTATATAVDGKDYTFDTANPVKLDYEITKRPITITVGNVDTAVEWKASYPSSDFSTDLLTVTSSTLATDHSYKSANITASETVTAPATKRPLTVSDVVIQDDSENDVTSNYEVTCVPGELSEKVTVNLAAGWNTFWHPASLVKPASGVTPYIVTNVTTGGVAAEEQTYIQGNTAYLLNNTGSAGNVVFDVIYNQPAVTGMDSKFKKSEGITASSSNNYYVLKGSGFVWARSGDIPNYKCYLDLGNNPALSRGVLDIIIGGGDGTTGISEELIVNSEENDSDVWYDMSGRRLDGKPSRKGLYIKNGKKTVVK